MARTVRVKRGVEREDKQKNVKRKGELPALEMVDITNMKPFHLDVCWLAMRQHEFKMANLYGFLKWSSNLLAVDALLVEEFVKNYDPEDGSSVVKDRIVSIQVEILHQTLHLTICEMSLGMEASEDFKTEVNFKTGSVGFARG